MENEFVALRAVQIDALLLDNTLLSLLQAQIDKILDTANCLQQYKQHFRDCITPLYFLSYFLRGQSPGQRLLNICTKFPTTFKALLNYTLCFLLPQIALLMLRLNASNRKMQLWYSRTQNAYRLIDLIHYCLFLARGGPIRPSERMLGLSTVYVQKPAIGALNFAALNRELLGHSFVHLCFLVVPLFNVVKRRLLLAYSRRLSARQNAARLGNPSFTNASTTVGDGPPNGIVWCTECGQMAIGAVKAKRRRQRRKNGDDSGNIGGGEGEGWQNYCHFCLFQSDTFGTDGSQCQWQMLNYKKGK